MRLHRVVFQHHERASARVLGRRGDPDFAPRWRPRADGAMFELAALPLTPERACMMFAPLRAWPAGDQEPAFRAALREDPTTCPFIGQTVGSPLQGSHLGE